MRVRIRREVKGKIKNDSRKNQIKRKTFVSKELFIHFIIYLSYYCLEGIRKIREKNCVKAQYINGKKDHKVIRESKREKGKR